MLKKLKPSFEFCLVDYLQHINDVIIKITIYRNYTNRNGILLFLLTQLQDRK